MTSNGLEPEIIEFLQQSNYIEGVRDGLDQSVKAWQYIIEKKQLSKTTILQTHKILMKKQPIPFNLKGAWRKPAKDLDGKQLTGDVEVGGKAKPRYWAVPDLMESWTLAMNNSLTDRFVVTKEHKQGCAVAMHISFEDIHPFIDGNGRMGRILMNWQLQKWGLPVLIIREEQRQEYYKWFKYPAPNEDRYNEIANYKIF